jgi:HNH endonuclease/NUMOD4 motif
MRDHNARIVENWQPVVGFEELNSVSDLGRVRSEDREIPHAWGGSHIRPGCIRKLRMEKNGTHVIVVLSKDGRTHRCLVHQLVLEAFRGPCPEGMVARHLDEDHNNNALDNLVWEYPDPDRVDIQRKAIRVDYGFARDVLGYEHQYAMLWLARGYGTTLVGVHASLLREGLHLPKPIGTVDDPLALAG